MLKLELPWFTKITYGVVSYVQVSAPSFPSLFFESYFKSASEEI